MKFLILSLGLVVGAAQAEEAPAQARQTEGDVLLIEKVERARGMDVPRLGMRMAQVTAEYGEPISRNGPVGDPPITRWRYESFTVYFEGETVLHAVVHREALGLERRYLTNPGLLPEWARQDAILLAWPAAHTDWRDCLGEAEACYRAIIAAIAARQPVVLLVPPESPPLPLPATRHPVHTLAADYDDTWVRDSGPLTVAGPRWLDFRFDAWGGKFEAGRDDRLVAALARMPCFSHLAVTRFDWVLEGGAVETDGEGTLLTTAHCLETRAPGLDRPTLARRLRESLGIKRILWLEHGELAGDDTDGHVDTVARLVDPDTIAYQACDDPSDPHHAPLARMAGELRAFRTEDGRPYHLVPLPLPASCHDGERRLPASYANFLIGNDALYLPTYGVPQDRAAAAALARAFPKRVIVGLDCGVLIRQGGSLHCATMQLPAGTLRA